jgi:anaerobic magnesium-protoporphyrin IX monomethyl ester cyclase
MDIVLIIPPRIQDDYGYTPAGPSALSGSLIEAGFTSKVIDFNTRLDDMYEHDPKTLAGIENFFMYYDFYNANVFNNVAQYIINCAEEIISYSPRWLGISVFSYNSHRATRLISIKVKELCPDIKVVIGGGGIASDFTFPETLQEQGIIDAYIRGEGEIAIVDLLKKKTTVSGLNGMPIEQIDDIDSLPYPDYSDYKLTNYQNVKGLLAVPITGSRGCVAHCSFCDIARQWPKYRFRSGHSIAREVTHYIETYGVNAFRFTDSLINGSMKAFIDMCKGLTTIRNSLPEEEKFTWDAHFIVRNKRAMPAYVYDLMASAGAGTLLIGIESGSQDVRNHMKKMFNEEDLEFTMAQISRVGVRCRMLIIVGYPTETEKNFQETVDMFTKYRKYALNGIVEHVNLGLTLNLLPGTPLDKDKKKHNIVKLNNHVNDWICLDNPTLTYKERLKRRIFLQKHITELGYVAFEERNYRKQLFSACLEVQRLDYTTEDISQEIIKGSDFEFNSEKGTLSNKNVSLVDNYRKEENDDETSINITTLNKF